MCDKYEKLSFVLSFFLNFLSLSRFVHKGACTRSTVSKEGISFHKYLKSGKQKQEKTDSYWHYWHFYTVNH